MPKAGNKYVNAYDMLPSESQMVHEAVKTIRTMVIAILFGLR